MKKNQSQAKHRKPKQKMIRFAYLSAKKTFFLPKTLFHFIQRVSASFYLLKNSLKKKEKKKNCVYISAEEKSDVRKIKKQIFLMIEK